MGSDPEGCQLNAEGCQLNAEGCQLRGVPRV